MKVSIILTSYNYGRYLKDTINSVLNQTLKDWELVIIDDCSSDNSAEIIMEFANSDSRIKFIRNWENQGLSKSLQTALAASSGEWVAFLESDDLWREDYLEKKLEITSKYPEVGLIYNNVEFFDEGAAAAEKKFAQHIKKNKARIYPRDMFYDFGYENPILTMSCVMIRRELLNGLDFNVPIDKLLDWYLYIQIARVTQFYYLDEALTLWRQHRSSYISSNKKIKWKFANISAYMFILKNQPWNLRLLGFIVFSTLMMCFKRLK